MDDTQPLSLEFILLNNPDTYDTSKVPSAVNKKELKCKLCNSRHIKTINFLIEQGLPQKEVIDYCNRFNLVNSLTKKNMSTHVNNHVVIAKSKKRKDAIPMDLATVAARLENMSDEEIAAKLFRLGAAPYFAGKDTPQLRDVAAVLRVVQDKSKEKTQQALLMEFFTANKKNPLKLGDRVKKKQTVTIKPVKGLEISQTIESD